MPCLFGHSSLLKENKIMIFGGCKNRKFMGNFFSFNFSFNFSLFYFILFLDNDTDCNYNNIDNTLNFDEKKIDNRNKELSLFSKMDNMITINLNINLN